MFLSIVQLARQSLLLDARRLGLHAVRFGLVIILYLAVCRANATPWQAAAGLDLFRSQLTLTAFFVSVTAIFGFSQAISEEKEDESLGLLRLANISPLSLLLGKTIGLLTDSGLLIAVQFPFTIVAMTLGGISWAQIFAAYVTLAAYLWLLAAVGLTMSVVCSNGVAAARWTAGLIAVYVLPPYLGWWTGWLSLSAVFGPFSLVLHLTEITNSGFVESAWSTQVGFGFVAGLFCLIFSWLSFDWIAFDGVGTSTRTEKQLRQRIARRPWTRPIIWREYLFLTGGLWGTMTRVTIQFSIVIVMLLTMGPVMNNNVSFVMAWSAIFSGIWGVLDGTWTASQLFRDEIRNRTWSALVQIPKELSEIACDKLYGWALGLAPSIVSPFLLVVAMLVLHDHVNSLWDRMEVVVGTMTIGFSVFGYLHLLVLLSLYFGWKGTPMTLTVCFAAGFLYVSGVYGSRMQAAERCGAFVFTTLMICVVMFVLQQLILRRLTELAETA